MARPYDDPTAPDAGERTPDGRRILYHVTPASNLASIGREGLRPTIGDRSREFDEPEPAAYFFRDLNALETALMNWMGEEFYEFHDVGKLALLRVELPLELEAFTTDVAWETQVSEVVPPEAITVVDRDYDS